MMAQGMTDFDHTLICHGHKKQLTHLTCQHKYPDMPLVSGRATESR